MDKLYTFAGVSRKHNDLRLRVSNLPDGRASILEAEGHTDIDIVALPSPMTKEQAVLHLLNSDFVIDNDDAKAALELEAQKRKLPGYAKAKKEKPAAEEVKPEVAAEELPEAEDNVIVLEEEVKPKKAKKSSKAADAMTAWAEAANAEEAEEQAA